MRDRPTRAHPIPLTMVYQARRLGLKETEIAGRWSAFIERMRLHTPDYVPSCADWGREIGTARVEDPDGVQTVSEERSARRREDERLRLDAEAAEYDRNAVSFPEWCKLIARARARGVVLSPVDDAVVTWWAMLPEPKPHGISAVMDFADWASLSGLTFGRPGSQRARSCSVCHLRECHSWVWMSQRYYAGTCKECGASEARERAARSQVPAQGDR